MTDQLSQAIDALADRAARKLDFAKYIISLHNKQGTSDESVIRLTSENGADFVGPSEQYGHLATSLRGDYIRVTSRTSPIDLARWLAGPPSWQHLVDLRAAAWVAGPMVAADLEAKLAAGDVDWDTSETADQAGLRLAMAGAWDLRDDPNPASAKRVYAATMRRCGWSKSGLVR
jgi:hypothetical protein